MSDDVRWLMMVRGHGVRSIRTALTVKDRIICYPRAGHVNWTDRWAGMGRSHAHHRTKCTYIILKFPTSYFRWEIFWYRVKDYSRKKIVKSDLKNDTREIWTCGQRNENWRRAISDHVQVSVRVATPLCTCLGSRVSSGCQMILRWSEGYVTDFF